MSEETQKRLGEYIRDLRKKRGMTQTELGDKIGVNKSTIAVYESGKNNFTISTLERLSEALEVKLDVSFRL